jgi:putative (di)nucleoside polyphosphate hydrolase
MPDSKPYRPNVGIALFNASGLVLIGRRFRDDGPEIVLPGLEWQMPQGGIDAGEDPRAAVMRELWEETGAVSHRRIASRNSAASAKSGSRCASPAATARSTR